MDSLSLSTSLTGECGSFVSGSYIHARKDFLRAGLHLSLLNGVNGVWLRHLQQSHYRNRCKFSVYAIIKKSQKHNYPWPDNIDLNQKGGYLKYLSHFKPLAEKPKPVTLDFEKPLVELEKKLTDVRKMAGETGLDFSDQISLLERKYQEAVTDLYTHLTPFQRLNIARHPNRPTFLDHVLNITDKWVELHGDRAGYDDPAIVTGLGSMDGKTYMFIGHQKGRNTKENIFRNFGMPTPHGYRKALRLMRYADHHKFPIITFIDTPGAFADLKSEEIGQGEAIAFNLRAMFGLEVPIVSVVIGEGGSGGALAIGCANKMLMLENAVFYVASPEACAAILWKTSKAAPKAAEKLKITASELCKLEVADGIIPEPLGGAHTDPTWTSQQIKLAVTKAMEELNQMDTDTLLNHRNMKFRKLGGFEERLSVDPKMRRNMKKSDASSASAIAASLKSDIEKLRSAIAAAGSANPDSPSPAGADIIEALKRDTSREIARAVSAMGLKPKLESLRAELSKEPSSPALKDRADRFLQEFKDNLSTSGAFDGLKQKLQALSEMNSIQEAEMVKKQINEKLDDPAKEKIVPVIKAHKLLRRGEELDEETLAGVRNAEGDLIQVLESAGLEMLGVVPQTVEKANEIIFDEVDAAVDAAGLRAKLAELRSEMGRVSGRDDDMVKRLTAEIKEGILSSLDANQLLEKVRTVVSPPAAPLAARLAAPPEATGADES